VIVIEMDVHARHDVPLKVVLDMGELPGEIAHMMVVDEGDRCDRLAIRFTAPFLTHQLIADEIAQRFRARGIFATPNDVVEVIEQMVV